MEDKTKLLELEKRVVDVELNLEKINKKLEGIEAGKLKEFMERFEDLEDLVMVENAGVAELKKLLEKSLPVGLDEKINSVKSELEKKIDEKLVIEVPQPVLDELKTIKNQTLINKSNLEAITKNLEEINKRIASLQPTESILDSLNKAEKSRIELEEKLATARQLINKILPLENRIDSLVSHVSKIEEIEKLVNKLRVEIEKNKKDILSIPNEKDIENRINQHIGKEISLAKLEIENINKRIGSVITKTNELSKEIEKNKKDILSTASIKTIEELKAKIDNLSKEVLSLKQRTLNITPSFEDFINRTIYLEARLNKLEQFMSKIPKAPIIIE